MGHSTDACYTDGKLIEKTVPENCIYVTFTECGLISFGSDTEKMKYFNPKYRKYFLDPVTYKKELNTLFNNSIHIHLPGSTYIDTIYGPVGHYKKINAFALSGVIPIEEGIELIPEFSYNSKGSSIEIDKFYKYSIYPTQEDIKTQYDNLVQMYPHKNNEEIIDVLTETIPTISQSKLFELRPGIYYNPLCRTTSKLCYEAMKARRRYSLAETGTIINEIDLEKFATHINKITYNCVKDDSCEELKEFNEQIPELSSVGLFAVKKVLELYKTDISNRTLFKVFKNVNSSMRKASDLHILITAYISNIMNESMTSANIEAFINHINTKSPEEKATIIKLIDIHIDRTKFTLDKLRASLKLQEGGRGKTRKSSRKNRK